MWNTLLYQPIYNALIFIYNIMPVQDLGLAIIVLTLVVRLLLLPMSWPAAKSQRLMQALQPELDKLKVKYKDDQKKLAEATMAFYSQHKINPLSSCLPLLIQLPILIAFYQVLKDGLTANHYDLLYSFVAKPDGPLNTMFLGMIDLTKAFWPLAILAGLSQFVQAKLLQPNKPAKVETKQVVEKKKDDEQIFNAEDMTKIMGTQFMYVMPLMTVAISWKLFAGLPLYWLTTTIFTIISQLVTIRLYPVSNINKADEAYHHHDTKEFVIEPEILEKKQEAGVGIVVKKRSDIKD